IEGQWTTVDKVNVEPSVAIAIEERDPTAHGVPDIEIPGFPALVSKADPAAIGNVLEPERGVMRGRLSGRAVQRARFDRGLQHRARVGQAGAVVAGSVPGRIRARELELRVALRGQIKPIASLGVQAG